MKEIRNIIQAFEQAQKEGKKTALATVVHVEGSSYRRPGARMLITEEGQLTGAISGGCLEGDALRKALLAITQQQNKLVTYDTTDEDDAKFGVQLGCNGIVHILFEPVQYDKQHHALNLLSQLTANRAAVLITIFSLEQTFQPGTSLLYSDGIVQSTLPEALQQRMNNDVQEALLNQSSSLQLYEHEGLHLKAFVEYIEPPVSLVIAGAGNDIQPLVELTAMLGWNTTVVDGRPAHATSQRFPKADNVLVAKPEEVLPRLHTNSRTLFLLMTHNYNYDLALLEQLLKHDFIYIGILGPKKKLDRMLGELNDRGITLTGKQKAAIYGPVGLDIGAETAEEIAVSVVAEIKAVLSGGSGTSLKEKIHSIHSRM